MSKKTRKRAQRTPKTPIGWRRAFENTPEGEITRIQRIKAARMALAITSTRVATD